VVVFVIVFFGQALRGLMTRDDFSLQAPGGFELSAKRREQAAAALTAAASAKDPTPIGHEEALDQIDDGARVIHELGINPRLLWVDGRLSNNRYERAALEALGLIIELGTSTEDALHGSIGPPVNLIISDMGRPPDPQGLGLPFSWDTLTEFKDSVLTGNPAIALEPGGAWAYLESRPEEAEIFGPGFQESLTLPAAWASAASHFCRYCQCRGGVVRLPYGHHYPQCGRPAPPPSAIR
jgi:hypothetical protein